MRREIGTEGVESACLSRVGGKSVIGSFDGGPLTSDGGVVLLGEVERHLGIIDRLAAQVSDPRDPSRITHTLSDIYRARVLGIACGYEDGNDFSVLRHDPAFKLACDRFPDSGEDLCSQPTVSRAENLPTKREALQMGYVMIDLFCESYGKAPKSIVLDIDDTCDEVHGAQQMSLFNAKYDTYCFQPVHVYDAETGRVVMVVLRPGKTPSGAEIRAHLRRLVRRIRRHWKSTKITFRGDSHYGRQEVMEWCEENGHSYVFGFGGNAVMHGLIKEQTDNVCVLRAEAQARLDELLDLGVDVNDPVLVKIRRAAQATRGHCEFRYGAKSWKNKDKSQVERRTIARIEATPMGLDVRYVMTNLTTDTPEHIYEVLYCGRGQMENLIKLHKAQLHSDRTSCCSPVANQIRIILHTVAYWLILTVRDNVPKTQPLAKAEFKTIQQRLLKVAARIVEYGSRVRISFASSFAEAELFLGLLNRFAPSTA